MLIDVNTNLNKHDYDYLLPCKVILMEQIKPFSKTCTLREEFRALTQTQTQTRITT